MCDSTSFPCSVLPKRASNKHPNASLCNVINACIHLLFGKCHSAALVHDVQVMNGWLAKYKKCTL